MYVLRLKAYKSKCQDFMPEFFNCGDIEVVQNFFQEVEDHLFSATEAATNQTVSCHPQPEDSGVLIPPVTILHISTSSLATCPVHDSHDTHLCLLEHV